MKNSSKIFAGVLAVSISALTSAQAATVYIPGGSAGEVLIVDGTTDNVLGRLTGLPEIHGLGGAPGSRYLVAGSYSEVPASEMPAVAKPAGVSEDEHAAHHGATARTNARGGSWVSILTVIDAATASPVRRLEVPGAVHHVAVSPDGHYAVAIHPNADGISIIDLIDLTVRDLVRTGPLPNYAVFSADGSMLYVSNSGNGTVSEIETSRWIVRRNFLAADTPEHIVLAPDGATLYVANLEAGTVSALALETGEIVRSFAVGGSLHGLDIADDGKTLFVSGNGEDKLVAIDLTTGAMRAVPLGPSPYHLAVVRGTGKLYVSSRDEPKVWVVDEATLAQRATITIRGEGHQMVVLP